MLISIGSETRKRMKILGLNEYPFTISELKLKYRKQALKYHEDKPENIDKEKAKCKTQNIIEAYKYLQNLAIPDAKKADKDTISKAHKKAVDRKERDMFDLSEPCPECNGQGSKKIKRAVECNNCDISEISFMENLMFGYTRNTRSTGFKTLKCFPCNGTGQFKLRSGRMVECRKCKGIGRFTVKCKFCHGKGFVYKEEEIICPKCSGEGVVEIKVYNPVIPKGAIL